MSVGYGVLSLNGVLVVGEELDSVNKISVVVDGELVGTSRLSIGSSWANGTLSITSSESTKVQ